MQSDKARARSTIDPQPITALDLHRAAPEPYCTPYCTGSHNTYLYIYIDIDRLML